MENIISVSQLTFNLWSTDTRQEMDEMVYEIDDSCMLPYGGLFGKSHLVRVIRQIIADPFEEYRPSDLEELTGVSSPSIRKDLKLLTQLGLLIKDSRDKQHPIYRTNTACKRYLALTLLAYAVIDDINGTDCMNDAIAEYYDSELRERYEFSEEPEKYLQEYKFKSIFSDKISNVQPMESDEIKSVTNLELLAASA